MSPRRKPTATVHYRAGGWVAPDYSDLADCSPNYHRGLNGEPACTGIVVWKVVEEQGLVQTIRFYCDADLPAHVRPQVDNCPNCPRQHVQPAAEYRGDVEVSHLYRCPACGVTWSTNRDLRAYGEAA
ncbi:hypothetical protein ACH4N4_30650 [Streptomyces microflavus]|uniref:hypothetical protein n=1 Tax=Streptomyces microflavus TaxID=1919 RepID=UPI0037BCF3D8